MTSENSESTFVSPSNGDMAEPVSTKAQPIVDAFYEAVVNCGHKPPFKPVIRVATAPGVTRYDHANGVVVLIPYDLLPAPRRAAMDRFAAIGTLGLSGREQYSEVFHSLLVAHELGHWVQEVARKPLNRWQAEYGANRIMVAFWREHPAPAPAAPTENRLANFVQQPPSMPSLVPDNAEISAEEYFNLHAAEIEGNPLVYAGFQKMMVGRVIAEEPVPSFCQVLDEAWSK